MSRAPSAISSSQPAESPGSSRSSLALDTTHAPPTNSTTAQQTRRNRSALRDFYNITTTNNTSQPVPTVSNGTTSNGTTALTSPTITSPTTPRSATNPLNNPNFDAGTYTSHLLRTASLTELLQTEAQLLGEMRGLDGERKSLVYDNYSKLIDATETIAGMQKLGGAVEGGVGGMGTVEPAVAHIERVAEELSRLKQGAPVGKGEARKERERETVRWVLAGPERLKKLLDGGEKEEAGRQWEVLQALLGKWDGVKGVNEVRESARAVMDGG